MPHPNTERGWRFPDDPKPPTPRWVKIVGLVILGVVVLIITVNVR